MSTISRIARVLKNPEIAASIARRYILIGGIHGDRECMNVVRSWSSGKLPRVVLRDIYPGIENCGPIVMQKPEARTIGFSLDLQELVHVLSVAKFISARSILEIGTYDGFTTLNLAANLGWDGKVHTVDLPPAAVRDGFDNPTDTEVVGSKFKGEPEAAKIEQLWADSTKADWASFGGPFDMILIDGCHLYPYVKSDSVNALKHLRPGGTVLWHDYGHYVGVSKALDELAHDHPIAAIKGTRLACFRNSM